MTFFQFKLIPGTLCYIPKCLFNVKAAFCSILLFCFFWQWLMVASCPAPDWYPHSSPRPCSNQKEQVPSCPAILLAPFFPFFWDSVNSASHTFILTGSLWYCSTFQSRVLSCSEVQLLLQGRSVAAEIEGTIVIRFPTTITMCPACV